MNRDSMSDFDHLHPHRRPYADTDSDPDEPDIEEHFAHGPGGFFGRRTMFRTPEHPNPRNANRVPPDDGEAIIRRFTEMLGDIGGPGAVGRSGPDTLFAESGSPRITYRTISAPGFRGGVSSFTITSGPGGRVRPGGLASPGPPGGDADFDRYESFFMSLLVMMLIRDVEFSVICLPGSVLRPYIPEAKAEQTMRTIRTPPTEIVVRIL